MEKKNEEKIEEFDAAKLEQLSFHYKEILRLIGENPDREGLEKTPLRVAKAIQFLTQGYALDPKEILSSAKFREDYREMVIVKDIPTTPRVSKASSLNTPTRPRATRKSKCIISTAARTSAR